MGMSMYAILSTGAARVVIGVGVLAASALLLFIGQGLLGGGIFAPNWAESWQAAQRFLDGPMVMKGLLLSLWTGAGSSLLALWIAKQIVMSSQVSSGWIARLISPVLAVPHVAFAIGFSLLLWPGGWVARLLSPWLTGWSRVPDWVVIGDPLGLSLMIGLALREVPFLVVAALAAGRGLALQQSLAVGQSLGLSASESWHRLLWPRLWPRLRLPLVLVLAYGLTNVDMALVLGPTTPPTLAVQILNLFGDPDPIGFYQVPWSALVLTTMTGLAIGGILLLLQGQANRSRRASLHGPWGRWHGYWLAISRLLGALVGWLILLLMLFGFAATLLFAFSRRWRFPDALPEFSLATFYGLADGLLMALGGTLFIAFLATLVAMGMLVLVLESLANRGLRDWPTPWKVGLYLPLILPQILVVLAFYSGALMLGWGPDIFLILVGHSLFVFCFSGLLLGASWLRFDAGFHRQAQSLGLNPWSVLWSIKLPMLIGPFLFTVAMAMTVSFALYLPTVVLGGGRFDTLLTEGVHFASNVRRPQMALYALVQMVVSLLLLGLCLLLPRWLYRDRKGMQF